jgi:hypothetical protein
MAERKVLSKYYPPEFDPNAVPKGVKRARKDEGPQLSSSRLMTPFSMKCTHCGEYIPKGRKFNARKETLEERYLSIPIFRFYIRCSRCSGEITFRTDPKSESQVTKPPSPQSPHIPPFYPTHRAGPRARALTLLVLKF